MSVALTADVVTVTTLLGADQCYLLSSTLLSLVDGLQEASEGPLGHVPTLHPCRFIREAEMDALVDADIDYIPGQI